VRVEPGPGVDLTALERDATVGVLQVDDLDVALREADRRERAQQEEPRIGPAGRGDLLPFEVAQRLQRRILGYDQRRPLRP